MKFTNLALRIVENSFDTVDIRDIPRQFVGIRGSLPGLAIGHNNVWDQMFGTTPYWKHLLNKL